jgi:uncharacterized membrane protein YhhN
MLLGYLLLTAAHLITQAAGADTAARLTQALLMPALAMAARFRGGLPRPVWWALAFSWLGDTLPDFLPGGAQMPALIGSFLVAQLCYLRAFWPWRHGSVLHRRRALAAPYVLYFLVLCGLVVPHAGGLAPAVVVYGSCLVAMAALASGVHPLAWVGGAVFAVSDSLIALDSFDVWTQPQHDVWVMATYCLAQLLLILGLQARLETRAATGHHLGVIPA